MATNRNLTFALALASILAAVLAGCGGSEDSILTSDDSEFNLVQTVSDGAQRTTLAFSALAMMTGNLEAQSFLPPGKVADYTGFQHLRDNDADGEGHNPKFLTRLACDVITRLDSDQLAVLAALADKEEANFEAYGYARYPLMQAFRRLLESQDASPASPLPSGASALNESEVVAASAALYRIDGQLSYDRAVAYAAVIKSLTTDQKAYLDAMAATGWEGWPDVDETSSAVTDQIAAFGSACTTADKEYQKMALYSYAGDIFSWYSGNIEYDTYFCPERQGTYFGSFYMKDAPAVGQSDYSIPTELTAEAGRALCDASEGYVTESQAETMSSLVELQRDNLYEGTTSIVSVRREIATLLRGLLVSDDADLSIYDRVMELSETYGRLDGENNYHYATVIAEVYWSLSAAQKLDLAALRTDIMTVTYLSGSLAGKTVDYSSCSVHFLYAAPLDATALAVLEADYISDGATDGFFQ